MGEVVTPQRVAISPPGEDSYKYAWARYVARRALDNDLARLKARIDATPKSGLVPDLQFNDETPIRSVVEQTERETGQGVVAPKPGKFKVGIVGAGAAGLFSAMLFEWLNDMVPALEIDYDLIEAAGEERLGGRLYTHYFSETTDEQKKNGWVNHDYYDVGAMRYPENDIMKRTFRLFKLLGMKKLEPGQKEKVGDLIRYYMKDGEKDCDPSVCPSYFNNVRTVGRIFPPKSTEKPPCDPYNLNSGLPEGHKIPELLLKQDPSKLVEKALKPLLLIAKITLDEKIEAKKKNQEYDDSGFWEFFMRTDHMSTRQYLAFGTGWYDQALSETLLEELDFNTDHPEDWWCISGGTQTVPRAMAKKINEKNKNVQFNSQVVAIDANVTEHAKKPEKYVPLTVTIAKSNPDTEEPRTTRKENYLAVFNSTTLAAMQRMDLQSAGLLWGTKQAIRALGYGASCKVAIKFKTPWWQLEPYCINMGSVSRTDLPLRVCVYPSYNIEKLEGHDRWYNNGEYNESVLLCSYTWGQDAQRIGSLISRDQPKDGGEDCADKDKQLKSLLLRNLALLHAVDDKEETYKTLLDQLETQYVGHHAWDWYRDENMSGAFAYFGPSQYSNMWQEIIKPNAFGQLYLVGEASSSHHAWIVGTLESVVRAAYLLFEGLQRGDPKCVAYRQAVQLLKTGRFDGQKESTFEEESPFWPLPAEMPCRQEGVKRGEPQTDSPREAVADGTALTYAAAVAALSLVECYFEIVAPTLEQA
ncbi:hypothetical protein LQW54_012382 [Pestalotiopsis sp. IQ-011]